MKKLDIPANLTVRAYKSIKKYVLDGYLNENSRLTEQFLTRQLGISTSPVREALNRLESEGLIRIEPRKGACLRTLSRKEIADLYDLRLALEAHVVRTAHLKPNHIVELTQIIRSQRVLLAANDKFRYIAEDMRFHALLAIAAGNAQLCAVLENAQNQIWLARRTTYDLSSSSAPDSHEAVLRALEGGNRTRAVEAMSEHIERVRSCLLDYVRSRGRSGTGIPARAYETLPELSRLRSTGRSRTAAYPAGRTHRNLEE